MDIDKCFCSLSESDRGVNKQADLCYPLQQLKNEHEPLLEKINAIYEIVCSLHEKTDSNWKEAFYLLYEKAVEFFALFKRHLFREEHFLFPLLAKYIGQESGALLVMEHEHAQGKQSLQQFIDTFESRRKQYSEIEAKSLLSCLAVAYMTISDHIKKEESVIFPLAEKHLSDDEKLELGRQLQGTIASI